MELNRRDFTRLSLLAATAAALPPSLRAAPEGAGRFSEIRRGVGTFVLRGGTIGWLVVPGGCVVVDAQMPDTAPRCVEGLSERTQPPFDALVNTHHHRDHTGGNGVFRPLVQHIVAHENVPRLQRAAAGKGNGRDTETFADVTFSTDWGLDLGRERVRARYRGPAHTGGDATIHFVEAGVVHMGDLVFNRWYPFIDLPGGASIRGWVAVLEEVHRAFDDSTVFVFGHGDPRFGITGNRKDLLVQRDFLAALLEHVEQGLARGASREEITSLERFEAFPDHTSPGGKLTLPACLDAAWEELTRGA